MKVVDCLQWPGEDFPRRPLRGKDSAGTFTTAVLKYGDYETGLWRERAAEEPLSTLQNRYICPAGGAVVAKHLDMKILMLRLCTPYTHRGSGHPIPPAFCGRG